MKQTTTLQQNNNKIVRLTANEGLKIHNSNLFTLHMNSIHFISVLFVLSVHIGNLALPNMAWSCVNGSGS